MAHTSSGPCPNCGSKDNLVTYYDSDGSVKNKFCFTPDCTYRYNNEVKPPRWPIGEHLAIPKRAITKAAATKYDVRSIGTEVLMPYYDRHKVVAVEVRNFLFDKREAGHWYTVGSSKGLFFGTQAVHTKRVLALCFGIFDAMSVFQSTGVACLSVSDSKLLNALRNNYEWLLTFEELVVIPDNDESCRKALEQADELWPPNTKVVHLSHKDANEYSTRGQEDLLKRAFYSAVPLAGNIVRTTIKGAIKQQENQVGILTGTAIDRFLHGFRSGELTLIMGAPTVGKTTYTRWLVKQLILSGIRVAILSSEEGDERYANKLARNVLQKSNLSSSDIEMVEALLDERVVWYTKDTYNPDLFERFVAASARAYECPIILVDNVSGMSRPEALNSDVGNYVMQMMRLAKQYKCHILCVSHLSRVQVDEGMDDASLMQLGFGSSALEKYAWNIAVVLRKPGDRVTTVRVVKNREIGPRGIGSFKVEYDEQQYNFIEYKSPAVQDDTARIDTRD